VIALTQSASPLAGLANILIGIDRNERWNPIVSWLAHLVTVETLVVAVALLPPFQCAYPGKDAEQVCATAASRN
jgi:DNA-binding MurR/RpiR family transcriptional regulator